MAKPLRVLLIEDSEDDAELLRHGLESTGYAPIVERVETPEAMTEALDRGSWDIVISDHNLPRFNAPAALQLMKERGVDLPFVIVSGAIGEDAAVAAMRAGADDYVMKSHLARFAPAVDRALRDATERARRKELEAELLQSQKIEAVGRMAGGVAHDFKNILSAISGYAELLDRRLEDERFREYTRQILRAAQRGSEMTRQLLAFSRRQQLMPSVIDLNEIVRDAAPMLQQLVGRGVELTLNLAPEGERVRADPVQLQQVLMNLVVNARDATAPGGTVTITTDCVDELGMLSIKDTGHGMEAETMEHIFEPFFTTKPEGQGTGLGLSTVYGIVTQSGGQVRVESAPGRGSTFTVLLPRWHDEPS